ncbi:metal-dependent hydrolase [Glaciecola petra]|uniref:Metal-dependent hydrolase n=1 Tax=Glaciecola petra TaxID=3075602 RepID=A0ABU2ZTV3_9ALTE|nr:metal-dependent hydrolase [Aestuariibacter sp. P117]MDT0595749.1 metal-dependent hydrolase [Aestuariibacter sp. P117]
MDSLTQIALGGAVAYAVAGPQVGRKAILWGVALGTLPDLDVLLPYGGEVEAFTYHRGFSHSLLMHILITPIIAWLALKLHPQTSEHKIRWVLLVFLCLSTHAILDSFTVYGTQLMWPLTEYPFGVSNLFIIDPLYTLPLLVGFIWASLPLKNKPLAFKANALGLVISSLYICWSLGAKVYIDNKVEQALSKRAIVPKAYMSTPAPLNTLLWRIVVMSEGEYHEIYASVFDQVDEVSFNTYSTHPELLDDISQEWGVQRLQWFTKGLYSVRAYGNKVVLSDLRMGVECNYVFNFVVGEFLLENEPKNVKIASFERFTQRPDFRGISDIFERISDPSVTLAPAKNDIKCSQIPSPNQ